MTDPARPSSYVRASVHDLLPAITPDAFRAGASGIVTTAALGKLGMPTVHYSGGSRHDAPIQKPVGMPPQSESGFPSEIAYPAMWVARLRNVLCLFGGVYLTQDGHILEDSFAATWEQGLHWHLARDGAAPSRWTLKNGFPRVIRSVPVTGILLDFQSNRFLGHFYADALSRAWAIPYGRAYLGLGSLVSPLSMVSGFTQPLLDTLSVEHMPIPDSAHGVFCDEMIIASKSFQIQEYVAPASTMAWTVIRNRTVARSAVDPNLKIYISRRFAPNRPLVNEGEVEELFASLGYRIVAPEHLPIGQQIALFSTASAIAGCSGTNLFNLAFAAPECAITVMVSPRLVHFSEMFFCYANTGGFRVILGEDLGQRPGDVHAPWRIDIDTLRLNLPV